MADFETKDSGKRQEFSTGSLRDTTEGKGSYISLSPHALKRWAKLMERGAKKYGLFNWTKGQPFSRLYDSAIRHLMQARAGETDEDHKAAVLFNVAALIHFEEEIAAGRLPAELDDMPKPPPAPTPAAGESWFEFATRVVQGPAPKPGEGYMTFSAAAPMPATDCLPASRHYCA